MGIDNDRDSDYEEFIRATGRGKKTKKNPKGAGRPTNLEREYTEFREWKALRDRGFTTRDISEIILGLGRPSEGRREGDLERKPPRILGRVLEGIGFKEKEIEKINMDKVDKSIYDTSRYLAPYLLPKLMLPVGILAGLGIWYGLESIPKIDKYTPEEWEMLPQEVKNSYVSVELVEGNYKAKTFYLEQTLHESVFWTKKLLKVIVKGLSDLLDVDDDGKYSYIDFVRDHKWQAYPPFGFITYWIQRRRYKKE